MAEKYYKVAESDLVAIADAIRLQRKSEKKYQLKDFARIIKSMLVMPSGNAETDVTLKKMNVICSGILPVVQKGVARSDINIMTITTSADGELIE